MVKLFILTFQYSIFNIQYSTSFQPWWKHFKETGVESHSKPFQNFKIQKFQLKTQQKYSLPLRKKVPATNFLIHVSIIPQSSRRIRVVNKIASLLWWQRHKRISYQFCEKLWLTEWRNDWQPNPFTSGSSPPRKNHFTINQEPTLLT